MFYLYFTRITFFCICSLMFMRASQYPNFGDSSSTNSEKAILLSPSLSHFYIMPCNSLSVAKKPLLDRNSRRSSRVTKPSPSRSMYVNAYLMLKYGRCLRLDLKTSQALSHLNMLAQRALNSYLVSALKNCDGGTDLDI